MIIGDSYVFIQNPRSASSSMGNELITNYRGREIAEKHSPIEHYSNPAKLFTFAFIRNPLDKLVTQYLRLHSKIHPDHPLNNMASGTFSEFCKLYYASRNYHRRVEKISNVDFVGRYENIQEDFSKALRMADQKQIRPLPWNDKTTGKKPFLDYYTPELIAPTMKYFSNISELGYCFPRDWTERTE